MNLVNPYGSGNHPRISWRRAWDVDLDAFSATHRSTGFSVKFEPHPEGGYRMEMVTMPVFKLDGDDAVAQLNGLRELLKDGWEIFHTVAKKAVR